MAAYPPGTAPVKAEYVLAAWPARSAPLDAARVGASAEGNSGRVSAGGRRGAAQEASEHARDGAVWTEEGTALEAETPGEGRGGSASRASPPARVTANGVAPSSAGGATPAATAPPRKRARGQNKGRTFAKTGDSVALCSQLARGIPCGFGNACRFGHDLCAYLQHKQHDIHALSPRADEGQDAWLERVHACAVASESPPQHPHCDDPVHASLDTTTHCVFFGERGVCPAGWKCRFLGAHVRRVSPSRLVAGEAAAGVEGSGLELVRDEARAAAWHARRADTHAGRSDSDEMNWVSPAEMRAMRSRAYPLEKTPAIVAHLQQEAKALVGLTPDEVAASPVGKGPLCIDYEKEATLRRVRAAAPRGAAATEEALDEYENELRNAEAAADTARVRPCEKRRLQWRDELYLAPLTTTGNLPFRRLCARFGSDIHCGEMGLAESFSHGNASEWSLARRWEGERIFGTQLCGGKPEVLVPAAEALASEIGTGLDFVDVNCGCPIDFVYNKGAGSALLDHANKLGRIVRGMSAALGETPVTIKLRTGTSGKPTAHRVFARAQTEWGVGGVTLHGRSRKQRYKNDADWTYVGECVSALRDSVRSWNEDEQHADEAEMAPVPIYGNGDVYGWRDYYANKEATGVDGEMIARGALIKPWIFTEIRERRDWDISSRERLDIVREYASHGLSHWGSDTQGVNTTRRFLCEMLSFTHRYVPLGILEHVPVRMNDRPPPFAGRDHLESLLGSPSAQDWVRISEMFLGKAPAEWHFTHKRFRMATRAFESGYDALADLSAPLRVPAADRTYGQQFAQMYDYRLAVLRRRVVSAARAAQDAPLPYVERVLDVPAQQTCFIIGTLYLNMRLKPDVLQEIARDHSLAPPPALASYADPGADEVYLEDQSGRVRLVGDALHTPPFAMQRVTGVVVGALGMETPEGHFHVTDLYVAGVPPPVEAVGPAPAPGSHPLVVLASGLHVGGTGDAAARLAPSLDLLVEWLTGELGTAEERENIARITSVIIAGDSTSKPDWTPPEVSSLERRKPDAAALALERNPFQALDPMLDELCATLDTVAVLPGPEDPASISMPQQPLLAPLFPRASQRSGFHRLTNPAWLELHGRTFLGTSGQNVDDLVKYLPADDAGPQARLAMARGTLEWSHLAPTAPDTLWCYPFKTTDPFVLRASPDVYFIGNQPHFDTCEVDVRKPDGSAHVIRVILVPRFSDTHELVVLDMATLQPRLVRLGATGREGMGVDQRPPSECGKKESLAATEGMDV
ncbi:tRNA-dihydrouridine(47) synthase [NAD(P)(+)] [Malassezia sp. CBS 17886]|nr:tRNA-dihydrouridine(47) synthase [NAD(P)(+)] [Malassezia sp. CBS 17886]